MVGNIKKYSKKYSKKCSKKYSLSWQASSVHSSSFQNALPCLAQSRLWAEQFKQAIRCQLPGNCHSNAAVPAPQPVPLSSAPVTGGGTASQGGRWGHTHGPWPGTQEQWPQHLSRSAWPQHRFHTTTSKKRETNPASSLASSTLLVTNILVFLWACIVMV